MGEAASLGIYSMLLQPERAEEGKPLTTGTQCYLLLIRGDLVTLKKRSC